MNIILRKKIPKNFLSRVPTSIPITFAKITDKNFLTQQIIDSNITIVQNKFVRGSEHLYHSDNV